jgi:ribonuclease VapC
LIAIDSSALIAILKGEPSASACALALGSDSQLVISAVTLAESLFVSRTNKVETELVALVARLPLEIVPVDADAPWRVNEIHRRWGKGNHPARLNFVDCFSYDVARQFGCPLLFIGNDFSQTDIVSALA